jgi:hypothetical protein
VRVALKVDEMVDWKVGKLVVYLVGRLVSMMDAIQVAALAAD